MTPRMYKVLVLFMLILPGMKETVVLADEEEKVILISFEGMRNDLTRRFIKEGKLPNIEKVIDNGSMAKYSKTISPSLTAPSHAAIATGATPLKTSIVSNVWKQPDASITNQQDAFSSELEVNPLWVEAKKQGKTTATVAFAGANPQTGKQGDFTIYYGETWASSSEEEMEFKSGSNWKNAPKSYSSLKESAFRIKTEVGQELSFYVLAYDSTNDQQVNYDKFIVSQSKEAKKDDRGVNLGSWGDISLKLKDNQFAGFWFRFTPRDPKLETGAKLYRTAVTSGQIDGPEGFSEKIREQFGVFPTQDDDIALEEGWITRKEYEEISERFANWITDVSLFIKKEYNPDLLMFYTPQIDHQEHLYLLTDPRQPGYTPEKSEKYMKYIEWAYKVTDDMVGKTVESLDETDNLFIVSDHGMEPAHSTLEPNKVLKDNGLLVLDEDGKVDMKKTKAIAIPSGSAAHVYINLQSREKNGIVPVSEYEQVREEIRKLYEELKVTRNVSGAVVSHNLKEMWAAIRTGNLTFSLFKENTADLYKHVINTRVHPYENVKRMPKKANAEIKDHNEGDILLMAGPGYIMGNGTEEVVKPSAELGTHGGNPEREKLKAVFIAMGPNIPKGKQIQPISTLDIAPTIYEILGLETPSFVEGGKIEDLKVKNN